MSGTDYLDKLQSALKQGGIETCIRNALVLAERMKDVREDREHLSYIKKVQVYYTSSTAYIIINGALIYYSQRNAS